MNNKMKNKKEEISIDEKEEEVETKASKKIIITTIIILLIALFLLSYFFFFQYSSSQKRIKEIFDRFKSPPNHEFEVGSFSELTDACIEKEIDDSCEISSNEETKNGICKLSGNNNLVCILKN